MACGTERDNSCNKCPLMTIPEMKKTNRGNYDYRSDGQVLLVRWNDNSVVTVASNHLGVTPVHSVKRRVKGVKETKVPQPDLIRKYNEGMVVGWS